MKSILNSKVFKTVMKCFKEKKERMKWNIKVEMITVSDKFKYKKKTLKV
jgi:hypothetical protein